MLDTEKNKKFIGATQYVLDEELASIVNIIRMVLCE